MPSPPLVNAKLRKSPSRMGWSAYWIVDEQGRQLHTEPVCLVPDRWHEWFKSQIEEMEFEYWGLLDVEEREGESR